MTLDESMPPTGDQQLARNRPDTEGSEPSRLSPSAGRGAELVRQHYPGLYRLALATGVSPEEARKVAVQVLSASEKDPQPPYGGRLWLYHQLVKAVERSPVKPASATTQPVGFESALRQLVDGWDAQERQLAALHYLLGWQTAEIAALLRVGHRAVEAQLDIFRNRFSHLPGAGSSEGIPATVPIQAAGGAVEASQALSRAERRAAAYLDQLWPEPILTPEAIETLAAEIEAAAGRRTSPASAWRARIVWMAVGLALTVCLVAVGGASLLVSQGGLGVLLSEPTPTVAGLPTPFPAIPEVSRLTRRASAEEILARWQESPSLWHSLTLDVQTIDFGPANYIGPPRIYRRQAWVLQPDAGIELIGLLSEQAGQVSLVGGGRRFTRSYIEDRTESEVWSGEAQDLLADTVLRSMAFPAASTWAARDGTFWWAETVEMLGRTAVSFDWLNHLNQREARLWLDAETGIILRMQEYTGDTFDRLERDSLVTEFALQRREPPPTLIIAARQSQAASAAPTPGFQALQPTPSPAAPIPPLARQPLDPAPPGMDPSHSRLVFQFASEPEPPGNPGDPILPVEVFADGYYLGEGRFGVPWGLRCQRSPDGRRLAFNVGSDGAAASDTTLRWFNLNRPDQVYPLMPGSNITDFAFTPDGRKLAAAIEADEASSGIYLVGIATGESELILRAAGARSLVWSPDGVFVALIGRLPGEDLPAVLVVHVATRRIAYHGEPGAVSGPPPTDSPLAGWNTEFPVEMGGMDTCGMP